MFIAGLIFSGLAALLHVYIFFLESFKWTTPAAQKVFGISSKEAEATQEMAFNQGFYNLFLAIISFAGLVFYLAGHTAVGAALIFAGTGSMLAAAAVLLISSPDKSAAAIKQGTLPLLAIITLALSLAF
ncbi:DUF1304 domain-containing protein [Corynebacterium callunae]|uniref:DUF1304 domain-containing protein n=1 Tax=Corynebacterium callunae TaxID=1721 RepID=UPI0039823F30